MSGFFSKEELKPITSGKGLSCAACGLYKGVISPRMEPYGNFKKSILTVGEGPGEVEDSRGLPWQGKMGRVLQEALAKLGVDLFNDCLSINSVSCRPIDDKGNNREPEPNEIAACRRRVISTIEEYKPKVVIILGGSAVQSLIGYRWKHDLGGITRWRGWTIPDRDFHAWLCPTFHPSFMERSEKEVETIWVSDLSQAVEMVNVPFPEFQDESKQVEIVEDLSFLANLRSPAAVDFETSGLKPHADGHQIICASVCDRNDHAWAFMVPEKGSRNWKRFKNWLSSELWAKIASHIQFETSWGKNILNCEIKPWLWDTMVCSHILDNRQNITSIKFSAYTDFGVVDYDSEIESYKKSEDKNANSFNHMIDLANTEEGRRKMMIYCGLDALFEYRKAIKQMKQMGVNYGRTS